MVGGEFHRILLSGLQVYSPLWTGDITAYCGPGISQPALTGDITACSDW